MSTYQWKLSLMRLPINLLHCPGTRERLTSWTPGNAVVLLSALTVFFVCFFLNLRLIRVQKKGKLKGLRRKYRLRSMCGWIITPSCYLPRGQLRGELRLPDSGTERSSCKRFHPWPPAPTSPSRREGSRRDPSPTRAAIRGQTVGSRGNYRSANPF